MINTDATKMALFTYIFCHMLAYFFSAILADEEIGYSLVTVNNGQLQGAAFRDENGELYDAFMGVPYATPPLGALRFSKPEPAQSWSGILDVREAGPECVQVLGLVYDLLEVPGLRTDENCLTLNVIVPGGVERARRNNLPVMVFHHGGAFIFGSGSQYRTERLAVFGDVIVVSFNYRLGALGFMSTGNEISPGNFGLWDCQMALQWVQDNIGHFGGNPQRVTIFGQSAGGALVSHNLISPHTQSLFNRVIAISGASSGFFGLTPRYRESTDGLADFLGCDDDNDGIMVSCLRRTDAPILDVFALLVPILQGSLPNWVPVIDNDFVPRDPRDSIADGAGASKDFITGKTVHDSAGFVTFNLVGLWGNFNTAEDRELLADLTDFIAGSAYDNVDDAVEAMTSRYPNYHHNDSDVRLYALCNMTTDWWFGSGSHYEATHHSQNSRGRARTYAYDFAYRPSFSTLPAWSQGAHVEDLHFSFGDVFFRPLREMFTGQNFTEEDYRTQEIIMSYWTNFAKHGDPNVGKPVPVTWPQYDTTRRQKVLLHSAMTSRDVVPESDHHVSIYHFWNDEMERIGNGPASDTARPRSPLACDPAWKTDGTVFSACLDRLLRLLPGGQDVRTGLRAKILDMYRTVLEDRRTGKYKRGI